MTTKEPQDCVFLPPEEAAAGDKVAGKNVEQPEIEPSQFSSKIEYVKSVFKGKIVHPQILRLIEEDIHLGKDDSYHYHRQEGFLGRSFLPRSPLSGQGVNSQCKK